MASFYAILLLWLALVQLPILIFAQNVSLGSSFSTLDKNPSWNSPSGDFSFGFLPTQGQNLFLLSIWFAKIPEKTIVWTANGGKPVQRGSKVQLTSDGEFSLNSPDGTPIWTPEGFSGKAASAAMLDSGNFVLTSNGFNTLWSTFHNPTDTLLPTQILDRGGKLTSRLSDENYTEGKFRFILQDDRNLVMYPIARPTNDIYKAYWATMEFNGTQLVFNQSGYLYLALVNATRLSITSGIPVSTRDFYHRVTLDYDGALRQYTYPKSSVRRSSRLWSLTWSLPENICMTDFRGLGSGVCGYNSYCKLQEQRATCECPPGYIYNDQNYKFGGCKQSFVPPSCEAEVGVRYEIQQVLSTDWIYGDYEAYKSQTEDWCRERCLNDCLCAVAIAREGNCWLKRFPLLNGMSDSTIKGKALIKVGNSSVIPGLPPILGDTRIEKDNCSKRGFFLLGSSAFLNLILLLIIPLYIYWSYHKKQAKTSSNDCALGVNLRSFTYKELDEATGGFKEEIGQGAFSTVFKGNLQSVTRSFVAVKRLDKTACEGEGEFKAEMSAISLTNHKNLVKLLGFCDDGTNRLLVYEYMRNGSLADFLFGSSKPEWSLRIQIAFGIARGLAYLHEDCSAPIIHCDVKPQNILLNDTFMTKISDFGLAKLLKGDQTRTYTGIRGTKGYLAPEWFKNTAITAKVDVYSFGIMLLEIICCRKNVVVEAGSEELDILADWAYECCMENKFRRLVNDDEDAKNDRRLERLVMVAIWSIQEDPSLRPSMKKVTQMLEGAVEVSMPPCPSSFMSSIN